MDPRSSALTSPHKRVREGSTPPSPIPAPPGLILSERGHTPGSPLSDLGPSPTPPSRVRGTIAEFRGGIMRDMYGLTPEAATPASGVPSFPVPTLPDPDFPDPHGNVLSKVEVVVQHFASTFGMTVAALCNTSENGPTWTPEPNHFQFTRGGLHFSAWKDGCLVKRIRQEKKVYAIMEMKARPRNNEVLFQEAAEIIAWAHKAQVKNPELGDKKFNLFQIQMTIVFT